MSPLSRHEVEQHLENATRRLDALRARQSKLAESGSVHDQLAMFAIQVDLAHRTRERLDLERERVLLDAADLRAQLVIDHARHELGEGPAPTKTRTAEIARLDAEAESLADRARGMESLVGERRTAWARFRGEHLEELRAEVMAEAADLEADVRKWVVERDELVSRWADLDARWSAITRESSSPSSPRAPGHIGPFPIALEGKPRLPEPQEAPARVSAWPTSTAA